MTRRILLTVLGGAVALLLAIQLVPYRAYNPPVTREPVWDSPQTEVLARRACFDCHSNEVNVPWYGYVAPVAWVVRHHVDEGREYLNFSEMDRPQPEAHEAGEVILEGEMPPGYYLALHASANLTDAEWKALAAGLDATLGGEGHGGGEGAEHDDEDDD